MIKRLRKLGGQWAAQRNGMGGWWYSGSLNGKEVELRAYSHFAPRYDGDDDSFVTLWHTTIDGKPFGAATAFPVEQMEREERYGLE